MIILPFTRVLTFASPQNVLGSQTLPVMYQSAICLSFLDLNSFFIKTLLNRNELEDENENSNEYDYRM
jgi:hypothetical protein